MISVLRKLYLPHPIIILSKPTLSQNIGATARAMLNFGLTELRLADPKTSWLNEEARALAADADAVLENARLFQTTEEACADLQHVYATTARPRDMIKDVVTPQQATQEIKSHLSQGRTVGILFGSEKRGLENDEVVLADKIISIPLNPDFSSLNLAQSVIVIAYEWYQSGLCPVAAKTSADLAPRQDLIGFFEHLEAELTNVGYFRNQSKRPVMQRNLRNIFLHAPLTTQEVKTLRGVVAALMNPNGIKSRPPKRRI
jgi:tRNA/rRNA methyltransferase